MKLAILGDTHDRREIIANACDVLSAQGIDYMLHAGDITLPATAERLAGVPRRRFIAVFGNCDYEKAPLRAAVTCVGGEIEPGLLETEVEGKKIAMAHNPYDLGATVLSGRFDLAVYGHTHGLDVRMTGRTLVINPGQGRAVILDLEDMSHEVVSLRR